MKKLFNWLFRRRLTYGRDIISHVTVLNSDKKADKDGLFSGLITVVDFGKRYLVITEVAALSVKNPEVHIVSFDNIVTISRMRDGRLRMWIKVEE